ncbi:cobalamin biosynthesis protein CobW [Maritalea sp.]|jgi:cobalamin biosynthesis protein CobW|uniref:cobalamin biosynthesis protein CobW n=1 Tax=Maritalea sp. TaxID=2003361 RepID=UPI0039E28026
MNIKIPATVITGFLGAGKTTLVRHVLNNAKGKRIALIINEFGDVGVDRDVLKGCGDQACDETDMIELANGCICCTVAEEFIPTITKLLALDPRPDHIVIETSGLALPQPLVRAFNWPEIKADVTVDGVVTVADASALAAGRFASDEKAIDAQRKSDEMLDHDTPMGELFEDQLVCADLILLNKTDLVEETKLVEIEAELRKHLREGVKLVRTQKGEIDMAALLGIQSESEMDMEGRMSHHERHHASEGDGHHHHNHEHDDFDSFSIHLPEVPNKKQLTDAVEAVIRKHDILRLKGFVAIKDAHARLSLQAVGPRIDTYFDRQWVNEVERGTALVVIGQAPLDRDQITLELQAALS